VPSASVTKARLAKHIMRFNIAQLLVCLLGMTLGQPQTQDPAPPSPCTSLANGIQSMAEVQAHLQGVLFLGLRGAPADVRQGLNAIFTGLDGAVTKADGIRIKSCDNEATLTTVGGNSLATFTSTSIQAYERAMDFLLTGRLKLGGRDYLRQSGGCGQDAGWPGAGGGKDAAVGGSTGGRGLRGGGQGGWRGAQGCRCGD
jgi:hypothetical protein